MYYNIYKKMVRCEYVLEYVRCNNITSNKCYHCNRYTCLKYHMFKCITCKISYCLKCEHSRPDCKMVKMESSLIKKFVKIEKRFDEMVEKLARLEEMIMYAPNGLMYKEARADFDARCNNSL